MHKTSEAVVKALFDAHPEGAKEKGQVYITLSPPLSPACAAQQTLLVSIASIALRDLHKLHT